MSTNFPVRYCHNEMRGAPQITRQPGTLLAALRAFLITGFGSVTAQSVTVDNGTATAVLGSGNTFEVGSVIQIEGAEDASLNGLARVASATASTITWATNAADGAQTGVIEIRYAPVDGWHEPFTGTLEKTVFRATDVQSAQHFLRVDDSEEKITHVRGYESMTGIDNGSGDFPKVQTHPNAFWLKSDASNNNPMRWDFIADGRMLLVAVAIRNDSIANIAAPIRAFGEGVALSVTGDPWLTLLSCIHSNSSSYWQHGALCAHYNDSYSIGGAVFCCRAASGLGGAVATRHTPLVGLRDKISGDDDFFGNFPSSMDGQLRYSRKLLLAAHNDNTARAVVPGVLHIPQKNVLAHISARDKIQGEGEMAGRTLLALPTGRSGYSVSGITLVDITGPWR